MLRDWLSFWAITASSTRPASIWSARNCSIFSAMPSAPSVLGREEFHCIRMYHGVSALSGSCTPGMCRSTMSVASRLISSQDSTLSSDAECASDRISIAACGSRIASHAVAPSLAAGHSFSTALVMMPSVPSAPR